MVRTTRQIKLYVSEEVQEELNRLESLYADFNVQEICNQALSLAIRRYNNNLNRISEDIKDIQGKVDILEIEIEDSKGKKEVLLNKILQLNTLKEEMEKEEQETKPLMLFKEAVYELSQEIEEVGDIDTTIAEARAESIGIPPKILINTAYDYYNGKIELNEIESRMPTLGDLIGI